MFHKKTRIQPETAPYSTAPKSLSYQEASNLWVGPRRAELNDARERFEVYTGRECSGTSFLRHVFALCEEIERAGQAQLLDKRGEIAEYRLDTLAGNEGLLIWRLVNRHGLADLRRAPDADNREILLAEMLRLSAERTERRERKQRVQRRGTVLGLQVAA